jgi:glycosyltransferase involved in cell wall biosynthesis
VIRISVVIVSYNVRAFLESTLVSVQKAMEGIPGEILVVDNASDDGSVEMVRQKFPGVSLIDRKSVV